MCLILTTAVSVTTGEALPHGIGWFVQTYGGQTLHWHYGNWQGTASLIIRAPEKGVTLIALANCNTLSSTYRLGDGDVTVSALAKLFLNYYVVGDEPLP